MSKFQIGDKVVIRKPENIREFPTWTKQMDLFDGASGEIENVVNCYGDCVYQLIGLNAEYAYVFNENWLISPEELREDRIRMKNVLEEIDKGE